LNIIFVVAVHDVPNLVDLLLRQDSTFTMASPFIVVLTPPYVKPILNITALYILNLPYPNLGTWPRMIQVSPLLPFLVFLLPTISS
jgi:hypothetical protein